MPKPFWSTDITLFEICLIHNCLSYTWILEDMLADVRLHLKDMVGGRAFAPVVVRAAVGSGIALPFGRFGHDALRVAIASNVHLEELTDSSHTSQLHRVRQAGIANVKSSCSALSIRQGTLANLALLRSIFSSRPQFYI